MTAAQVEPLWRAVDELQPSQPTSSTACEEISKQYKKSRETDNVQGRLVLQFRNAQRHTRKKNAERALQANYDTYCRYHVIEDDLIRSAQ